MKKQVMKRYSEAFKRQVVSEYEEGHSVVSLQARYGITGNGTIERWIKKYAHAGLRHEWAITHARPFIDTFAHRRANRHAAGQSRLASVCARGGR